MLYALQKLAINENGLDSVEEGERVPIPSWTMVENK